MKMIKYLLTMVAALLVVDSLGFMAWIISGQVPADGFYIGAITVKLLGFLL